MTTPTPIVCPDCGHHIARHGRYHIDDEGFCAVNGCKCENTPEHIVAGIVAETRRAALLEAAKEICFRCEREGAPELVGSAFIHSNLSQCQAWKIHALLAQEQAQEVAK